MKHDHTELLKKARAGMGQEGLCESLCALFKAFADPTRMKILMSLSEGELCVCAIAELLGAEQSAISHQLKNLKDKKLIKSRREGKTVFYSLDDSHVGDIIHIGCEHLSENR